MPIVFAGNGGAGQGLSVVSAFGAAGNGITDDSAAFLAAINATTGTGIPVYVPPGRYPVAISLTDQDVRFYGEGTLVHRQAASILSVRRTPGTGINVTGFGRVLLGVRSGVTATDTATFTQTITVASVAGFQQGQLYILSSQDAYGWSVAAAGFAGATIWQTQYVRILGIAVPYSGGVFGQFQEGQTIIGATSGATALLKSISDNGATGILVFSKITGGFSSGEALTVGSSTYGTMSGAAYLLTPMTLLDTYTTSPQLQLVSTTSVFEIKGLHIDANGDTDQVVGAANRLPAFVLAGVYHPVIRDVVVHDAWTRCFQLLSCWQGDIRCYIERLPNNSNVSESAYGYGVELAGSTEGTRVQVHGGNCRHAVTTNVFWGGFAYVDIWTRGTPRDCHIHDSVISGNFNAPFDTHAGCVRIRFSDCVAFSNSHANRNVAANIGFQNRGFGTRYDNCRSEGAVVGFNDISAQFDAGWLNSTIYNSCEAIDYQSVGFSVAVAEANNTPWYEFVSCRARGNGDAPGGGHYAGVGFWVNGFNNIRMIGCHSERFTSTPFWFGGGGYLRLLNLMADYSENPGFSLGMRFDGVPLELMVSNYIVRYDATHGAPYGIFYNSQSSPITVDVAGDISVTGDSSRAPLVDGRTTGAGPIRINWHGLAANTPISADQGDAAATLTPRTSPRINRWATPLTATRVVTLSTTATGLTDGDWLIVVRDPAATGAPALTLSTVPAASLAAGQSAFVVYSAASAAWIKLPPFV